MPNRARKGTEAIGMKTATTIVPAMYYNAADVMILLGIGQSSAYNIIHEIADEIETTIIPGTKRTYRRPPSGKVPKDDFCLLYRLNRKECDALLKQAKKPQKQKEKTAA
jgi:hypothetical protein